MNAYIWLHSLVVELGTCLDILCQTNSISSLKLAFGVWNQVASWLAEAL